MENTFKGFANYGVLAHEKQTIYTAPFPHGHATYSEEVEFTIPEGWEICYNEYGGELFTSPDGWNYSADQILTHSKDKPAFMWVDKNGHENWRVLEYKEI